MVKKKYYNNQIGQIINWNRTKDENEKEEKNTFVSI